MTNILLATSIVVLVVLLNLIEREKSKQLLHRGIAWIITCLIVQTSSMFMQSILCETYQMQPVYFEYISYIGGMFIPASLFMFSMAYANKNSDVTKWKLLFIPSIISLLILWTNDFHHWFYKEYSTVINETVFGGYFSIYTVWSYLLLAIGLLNIIHTTLKKSGFVSWQTGLIILGCLFPLVPNVLATFGIVSLTVYVTPIMFTATAVCFYVSIVRLKALNIVPVTFKAIVDNMSDSFVVVSEDGTIADLNKTFVDNFNYFGTVKDKDNLYTWMKEKGFVDTKQVMDDIEEARKKGETITKEYHIEKDVYDKYFEVDYQPIKSKDGEEYVATLILLRDVTTLKKDTEIMLKNESLVMLGELAGGVAHDINTPISAIKSGLLILKETVKTDDEKMLVERMDSCANKIVTLTNSLRNQIRNIGSDEVTDVNVTTVITDMATIIHNDLTKHKVKLNLDIKENIIVKGNAAKLSQVVTNIVINAIQAYNEKGGEVNLSVYNEGNNSVIAIKDFAGGIPEHIRENIGKNILTTKGVSGTGFGLYLAYSVIKGAFGGEITFDTELGKGTTFYITIPR